MGGQVRGGVPDPLFAHRLPSLLDAAFRPLHKTDQGDCPQSTEIFVFVWRPLSAGQVRTVGCTPASKPQFSPCHPLVWTPFLLPFPLPSTTCHSSSPCALPFVAPFLPLPITGCVPAPLGWFPGGLLRAGPPQGATPVGITLRSQSQPLPPED